MDNKEPTTANPTWAKSARSLLVGALMFGLVMELLDEGPFELGDVAIRGGLFFALMAVFFLVVVRLRS